MGFSALGLTAVTDNVPGRGVGMASITVAVDTTTPGAASAKGFTTKATASAVTKNFFILNLRQRNGPVQVFHATFAVLVNHYAHPTKNGQSRGGLGINL